LEEIIMSDDLEKNKSPNYRKYVSFGNRSHNLWMLLTLTSAAILEARNQDFADTGITFREYSVLALVNAIDGVVIPADIARWLRLTPQGISELLTRMEKRGLVKRKQSRQNKKLKNVVILPKGEEALRQALEIDPIHDIMNLTEEEFDELWSLLEKLKGQARFHAEKNRNLSSPQV